MRRIAWSAAALVILLAIGTAAYLRLIPGETQFKGMDSEIASLASEENDLAEFDMLEKETLDFEGDLLALADLSADLPQSSAARGSGETKSYHGVSSELDVEYDTLLNDFNEIDSFNSNESDVEGDLHTLS